MKFSVTIGVFLFSMFGIMNAGAVEVSAPAQGHEAGNGITPKKNSQDSSKVWGHEAGNGRPIKGGDAVVSEFQKLAEKLTSEIVPAYLASGRTLPFTLEDLKRAVQITKLESTTQELILDGVKKDALNHALEKPPRIEVQRTQWLALPRFLKLRLVLHEYIGIMNPDDLPALNDDEYRISNPVVSSFEEKKSESTSIDWAPKAEEILRSAYQNGLNAPSLAVQIEYYLEALKQISSWPEIESGSLAISIFGALEDAEVLDVPTRVRAASLRRSVSFAIEDIRVLMSQRSPVESQAEGGAPTAPVWSDKAFKNLLKRAHSAAYEMPNVTSEIAARARGLYRALEMLEADPLTPSKDLRNMRRIATEVYSLLRRENLSHIYKVEQLRKWMLQLTK